jgi:hypothetical protein
MGSLFIFGLLFYRKKYPEILRPLSPEKKCFVLHKAAATRE